MEKLTLKDMRNVDAAYRRGEKHVMNRLSDGALRLRKRQFRDEEHDRIHADLSAWLSAHHYGLRAPGVKDNLFRLSDYLSNRAPVPPREVLLFLHAYIFALEGVDARQEEKRGKKERDRWKPRKERELRELSYIVPKWRRE